MSVEVRNIRIDEINDDNITMLANKMQQYYTASDTLIEIDVDTVKRNWSAFLQSGMASVFVLEEDGVIVGIISGLCYHDPLSGHMVAQEAFWFVDYEYRHRGYGEALIKTFEEWAISKNAMSVRLAHLVDLRAKENQSLYEGLGYHMAEISYEKKLI